MFVGALLFAAAARSASQVPAADSTDQTEIIVTGERVKRSLKDTPSSVVVFGRQDLDSMAAPDRLAQLLQLVPNLLTPTRRDTPNIRGQSGVGVLQGLPAFLGGARPRTVMQIDGRTVTFNEFVNSTEGIWDVDRVEVFRSPQTTTQGVNSIAGAIFIHTAEPTYKPEERAQLIGGELHHRQASAVVSAPLVYDQLAFRLSGDFYHSLSSTEQSGPLVGVDNINIDHYWTTRAKLLAEPHAVPGLRVLTTYAHTHAQAPQGVLARPPFRERRDDFFRYGYIKSDVDSVTSEITYLLGEALESRTTLSWGQMHFQRFAPQGFGQTHIRGHDGSVESLVEWKSSADVKGIAGISLQRMDLHQRIDLTAANLGTGSFKDEQRSSGLFGELTWYPAPPVTLIFGARYQTDRKMRTGLLHTTPDLPLDYDKTTHAFLPKVSASYDLSDNVRIGVMVQRAYNPGGVTLDPAHHAQLDFKPEYLWSYEGFTRATLFGGRASLTANVFYNDMHDAQRELDFDLRSPGGDVGLLQIISEPRARTYGAEAELSARATSRLTLQAAIGLLNTRITKGIAPNDPFLGREFAGAPHFTASAAIDWKPVHNLELSAQARHVNGFWGDDNNDPLFRSNGWSTVDARISWRTGHLTMFGYAQNLFDTFRVLGWTGPRDNPDAEAGLTDPREFGVGLQARF